jgi:hypothetical protein
MHEFLWSRSKSRVMKWKCNSKKAYLSFIRREQNILWTKYYNFFGWKFKSKWQIYNKYTLIYIHVSYVVIFKSKCLNDIFTCDLENHCEYSIFYSGFVFKMIDLSRSIIIRLGDGLLLTFDSDKSAK